MPRADIPMSKLSETFDFSVLLTTDRLNLLKDAGVIESFEGEGKEAKIQRPGKQNRTPAKNKVNTGYLKKKLKQNPTLLKQVSKSQEAKEELKDKPSDIARQKKEAEEARLKAETEAKESEPPAEAKAPDAYLDHPLNRLLIELKVETNPFEKKKILAKARQLYRKHRTQNSLPRKIVSQRKGQAPYTRIGDAKALLDPKKDKSGKIIKPTGIDKARVLRSDLIDDIKQEGGLPRQDQEAFLYFVASAHVREGDELVRDYFKNRQAFMAKALRKWQANNNRQAYSAMSQDGVDIDAMTIDMIENYSTRVGFEQPEEEEEKPEEKQDAQRPEAKDFQLPEGKTRIALQPEIKQFQQDIDQANTDDEKRRAVDRFMENPRVQRAARGAGTAADFINLFRDSPLWKTVGGEVKDFVKIYLANYLAQPGEPQAPRPAQAPAQEAPAQAPAQEAPAQEAAPRRRRPRRPPVRTPDVIELPAPPQDQEQESDPVKVEAELMRLREQLTNLRTSKLNEVNEEQTFKKLRKYRPEIREFNPERLNYFISAENEELERKELVNFAYIPEVSQAGVYTEDYKDNPIVMGNIQNENIRFSNTQKQPMDYHPVGTYMLLDRIGQQMNSVHRDFNRAVASMRHQQRVDDGMFNQVFIPRIPPVEQPRNRKYRDMGDPVSRFASEPIVSLPKIDDRGIGGTNAQRDFTTSYSYRRHYIK